MTPNSVRRDCSDKVMGSSGECSFPVCAAAVAGTGAEVTFFLEDPDLKIGGGGIFAPSPPAPVTLDNNSELSSSIIISL